MQVIRGKLVNNNNECANRFGILSHIYPKTTNPNKLILFIFMTKRNTTITTTYYISTLHTHTHTLHRTDIH